MSYEHDGCIGYVVARHYESGIIAPGETIYSDRGQVQSLVTCLRDKEASNGGNTKYVVAGIVPLKDVVVSERYSGPFHQLDDDCR